MCTWYALIEMLAVHGTGVTGCYTGSDARGLTGPNAGGPDGARDGVVGHAVHVDRHHRAQVDARVVGRAVSAEALARAVVAAAASL